MEGNIATLLSSNEKTVVYEIKQLYMDIYLDDRITYSLDTWLVHANSDSVIAGNSSLRNLFQENPNISYSADADNVIFKKFFERISTVISEAINVANSINDQFGYVADLVGILLPFILQKTGVQNDEIFLFVPLVISISKISIDYAAKKKQEHDNDALKSSIEDLLTNNLNYINSLHMGTAQNNDAIISAKESNRKLLALIRSKK